MRFFLASAGIATLVALFPVAVQAQSTKTGHAPARLVESNAVCLDRLDWKWVQTHNRGRDWAASTKDERRESPRFSSPCARMTMPACSENYGYRGRVTKAHYLFKFPC